MSGDLLNEEALLTLQDLCENCGLTSVQITAYVEEGIVEVQGNDVTRWRFSEVSMVKLQKAHRLNQDLGLNPAGAALAMELLEKIDDLKNQLKRYE